MDQRNPQGELQTICKRSMGTITVFTNVYSVMVTILVKTGTINSFKLQRIKDRPEGRS